MGTSRDFLKLLIHEGSPLFNPLQGDGGNDGEFAVMYGEVYRAKLAKR